MEWIYTRTKVSGPESLELALEMKKKDRLTNALFLQLQKQLVQAYTVPDHFHGRVGA